jgi:hypothetical protein
MSTLRLIGVAAFVAVAAAPPLSAESSSSAAAAAANASAAAPAAPGNGKAAAKKYCTRLEATTGTRMTKGRTCRTKAEWEQQGVDVEDLK